ncbi:carbohydrate kinase family protein [Frigoribacterium sp. PhB24]|uniref:carbohydrate kinase family protein n=1 Tax=Frigoribacterium sp. PhB24 TaxID=2485204 RepID=UPI000FB4AA56|nr:PfkB family carbohydrate kinase [Frigoribacterium sp. PhB24]ROS52781.1 sugar/nucleoside kinase (ribokinase family) [Frigoribacterium sp. PhB24]
MTLANHRLRPSGDRPRAGSPVLVFGDVLDDIIVSPRTAEVAGSETAATIRHRAGGSAANTAAWLGSLGVEVSFVGRVGTADLQRHSRLLADAGVVARLAYDAHDPTGTVVITVDGSSRTMFTDRGAGASLGPDDVPDDLVAGAGLVHFTGYTVAQSRSPVAFRRLVGRAREAGALVSVAPGSGSIVRRFGASAFLGAVQGADLFFPSDETARELTGLDEPVAAATALAERFGVVALVTDDGGAIVASRDLPPVVVDSVTSRWVDSVGLVDAFSAGFIAVWPTSRSLVIAGRSGARAAARAAGVAGGRPPA